MRLHRIRHLHHPHQRRHRLPRPPPPPPDRLTDRQADRLTEPPPTFRPSPLGSMPAHPPRLHLRPPAPLPSVPENATITPPPASDSVAPSAARKRDGSPAAPAKPPEAAASPLSSLGAAGERKRRITTVVARKLAPRFTRRLSSEDALPCSAPNPAEAEAFARVGCATGRMCAGIENQPSARHDEATSVVLPPQQQQQQQQPPMSSQSSSSPSSLVGQNRRARASAPAKEGPPLESQSRRFTSRSDRVPRSQLDLFRHAAQPYFADSEEPEEGNEANGWYWVMRSLNVLRYHDPPRQTEDTGGLRDGDWTEWGGYSRRVHRLPPSGTALASPSGPASADVSGPPTGGRGEQHASRTSSGTDTQERQTSSPSMDMDFSFDAEGPHSANDAELVGRRCSSSLSLRPSTSHASHGANTGDASSRSIPTMMGSQSHQLGSAAHDSESRLSLSSSPCPCLSHRTTVSPPSTSSSPSTSLLTSTSPGTSSRLSMSPTNPSPSSLAPSPTCSSHERRSFSSPSPSPHVSVPTGTRTGKAAEHGLLSRFLSPRRSSAPALDSAPGAPHPSPTTSRGQADERLLYLRSTSLPTPALHPLAVEANALPPPYEEVEQSLP